MPLKFLDPPGLSRVGNMELVAKQVVEGFLTGRHRSPYHGFSVEYLDHRPYTPGDDMRAMDWKMLARSDKYRSSCSKMKPICEPTYCSTARNRWRSRAVRSIS